jgi:hypothetical protein
MFGDPLFKSIGIKHARIVVGWDVVARGGYDLTRVAQYIGEADAAGVEPLVAIEHTRGDASKCNLKKNYKTTICKLPTAKQYEAALRAFFVMFPSVHVIAPWNEANHPSQPTWRHPERAAAYFEQMRRICRGCTIVALDVLDLSDVADYVDRFYDALPRSARRAARLVGIHNYSDVNRRRTVGTRTIMAAVRRHTRARFWLTETGGIVELGRTFRCSPSRAANRTSYLFSLLRKYHREIDRAYVYNWVGTGCATRMDTGMVNADGTPRPAYRAFVRGLGGLRR